MMTPTWVFVDAAGSIYVTGSTGSADFPTTHDAFQTLFGGGSSDAFVTKVVGLNSPYGSRLEPHLRQ